MSVVSKGRACNAKTWSLTEIDWRKVLLLFQPAASKLLRVATSMLGRFHSAYGEDIVQETFVVFSHAAARGELQCLDHRRIVDIANEELDQYARRCHKCLITIVVRKCCDYHRKVKLQPKSTAEGWVDPIQEVGTDPVEDLIWQEQISDVRKAMMALPKHLYKILVLRFDAGYSEDEIAGTLGISLRTAQRHLHDIRERLRIRLSADMMEDII